MRPLVADRYAIEAPIGRGRSTVYRGTDTRLGRAVALKEVRLANDDESHERVRSRALREARAAARLSNPSVVTVYDVIEEEGSIWLVMELVDAPSLSQLVSDRGPLDHARVALIGSDVLGALEAAHGVGVVHRDVKPANVLVGLGQRAKLADFGVAYLLDDSRVTATGLVIGSPAYMAPEQALGEDVGAPADLWALGATLYYAYEGRPPFDAGSAVATATAVVHGSPRAEQHPGPLSPIVARLLAKDPDARPSTRELHRLLLEVASTPAESPPVVAPVPVPVAGDGSDGSDGSDDGGDGGDSPAEGTLATTAIDREELGPPAPTEPAPTEPAPAAAPPTAATERHDPAPVPTTEAAPSTVPPATLAASAAAPAPAPAPVVDEDREPPGRRAGAAPTGQRRRVVILVAAIAVALAGLAWLLTVDPDDYLADDGDGGGETTEETEPPTETTQAAAQPPDAEPDTSTTEPETTTSTTAGTTTTAASTAGAPADWVTYTHPEAGYTIAHPPGWQVVPDGHRVDIEDPNSSTYLRVDWTDEPKDDPVADWRAQAERSAPSRQDYVEHRIEAYPYRDYDAAMWEFSWTSSGTRLHAGNLGFVAGDRGYALFFVTAEEDWQGAQSTYRSFQDSFQP